MAKAIAVPGERVPAERGTEQNGRQKDIQKADPKGPNQLTSFVERSTGFLKDVRNEMRKVVTPSRQEVQTTTGVVIGTVSAFAAFFWAIDGILTRLMQGLLHWLGSTQ
jgi:preprotein translocase subunit SecE